jgi:agmatine/peptidylarginine deiminase
MTAGSPESKSMAEKVSQAIPRFQTISVDSLRVLYGNGSGFHLTRQ